MNTRLAYLAMHVESILSNFYCFVALFVRKVGIFSHILQSFVAQIPCIVYEESQNFCTLRQNCYKSYIQSVETPPRFVMIHKFTSYTQFPEISIEKYLSNVYITIFARFNYLQANKYPHSVRHYNF